MSSAFPCGTPSTMSNSTTSPSSLTPASSANVPPIWPAPISAILLRAISNSLVRGGERRGSYREFPDRARRGRSILDRLAADVLSPIKRFGVLGWPLFLALAPEQLCQHAGPSHGEPGRHSGS